jgi:pantothenate kinase type III
MANHPIYPMFLADAGNTSVKFAVVGNSGSKPRTLSTLPTNDLTAAKVRTLWKASPIHSAAASCVVPKVAKILRAGCPAIRLIGGDSRLNFATTVDLRSVGADRLANMAEAARRFGKKVIVADFGTAATMDVLDDRGCFVGGAIAPGLRTMAATLSAKTAQLPVAGWSKINRAAGRNTRQALSSGLAGGYAGMVRHLLELLSEENFRHTPPRIVFTGGDALTVSRLCALKPLIDPLWTLRGIAVLGHCDAGKG